MKSVIVLMDNEKYKSPFLNGLGNSYVYQDPKMCAMQFPTKLFNFEVYGLVESKKIDDYLETKNGVIILIDMKNDNTNTINRIRNILDKNTSKQPILCMIENRSDDKFKLSDQINSMLNVKINDNYLITNDSNKGKYWFTKKIEESPLITNPITSRNISIKKMVELFENNQLPLLFWDHYGRLRLVHFYATNNMKDTLDPNGVLCRNWRQHKQSIGHGNLWNYTLTMFWAKLMIKLQLEHKYKTFDELYKNNPELHRGSLFREYYSDEIIFSNQARNMWIDPDKKALNGLNKTVQSTVKSYYNAQGNLVHNRSF